MRMDTRRIINKSNGHVLLEQARWCDSFTSKLRGFTFQRSLAPHEGLVLVEGRNSRMNSSIHMLFVFFDLGVIWVNDAGQVVDTALARSWRPSYTPQAPARYVIEGHPVLLQQVQIGDQIHFEEIP